VEKYFIVPWAAFMDKILDVGLRMLNLKKGGLFFSGYNGFWGVSNL